MSSEIGNSSPNITALPLVPVGMRSTSESASEPAQPAISHNLLAALRDYTHGPESRMRPAWAIPVDESVGHEGASRLMDFAHELRQEKYVLPSPGHARDFLAAAAEHHRLTEQERAPKPDHVADTEWARQLKQVAASKAENVQEMKREVVLSHGHTIADMKAGARRAGRYKNIQMLALDLLALVPSTYNQVRRWQNPDAFHVVKAPPGQAPISNPYALETAQNFKTMQFTLQAFIALASAFFVVRAVSTQPYKRAFSNIGMGENSSKLKDHAAAYEAAAKLLDAELKRGAAGPGIRDMLNDAEAAGKTYKETWEVHKNKYKSQAPEFAGKVSRQLGNTIGLTVHALHGSARVPIAWSTQVAMTAYGLISQYALWGPWQDDKLQNLGFENKLNLNTPAIAKGAAERATSRTDMDPSEVAQAFGKSYKLDAKAEAELLKQIKGPNQVIVNSGASPFFGDMVTLGQIGLADSLEGALDVKQIGRRHVLMQKDMRSTVSPATEYLALEVSRDHRTTQARGPQPGKALSPDERTELASLDALLEAAIDALPEDQQAHVRDLRTRSDAAAADIVHLERGEVMSMHSEAQRLLLHVVELTPEQRSMLVQSRVRNNFAEIASVMVQRVATAYNFGVFNAAMLIGWSAMSNEASAKGSPYPTNVRVGVTWLIFTLYAMGATLGAVFNTQGKLVNRGAWVKAFKLAPSTGWPKPSWVTQPDVRLAVRRKATAVVVATLEATFGMAVEAHKLSKVRRQANTAGAIVERGRVAAQQQPRSADNAV